MEGTLGALRADDHTRLIQVQSSVISVALGTLDDRSVIVSGGHDGTLRVWDLATGTRAR